MKFQGDLVCAIEVKDLNAAIQWYKDKLGFEERFSVPEVGWAEMQSPLGDVAVGLGLRPEPSGNGGSRLCWGVPDIAEARKELEDKGVEFEGETMEIPGMVKLATFFDLDGNGMMLAESLADG